MKITRLLIVPAVAAALVVSLTGCVPPFISNVLNGGNGGSSSSTSVAGTTWSGVDSVGDATTLEFQTDGTVAVTYNDNAYDDPGDVWTQNGDTVTAVIFINSDAGNATYTGTVSGSTLSMTAVTDSGDSWTVALTQQ